MAVDPSTPVSAIEGIGPAASAALQAVGVFTVFDLLRFSAPRVHRAVHSLASEREVRSWRAMASMLQVAEVTPQWAEALVSGGLFRLADLEHQSLDGLTTVFRRATEASQIADLPTPSQMASMVKDAAVLAWAGSLTGTVVDGPGNATVAGATVRIGRVQETTDPRGRFRLLRVPWTTTALLAIAHPDFVAKTVPVRLGPADFIDIRRFRLQRRAANQPVPPPAALSELDGDELPPMDGRPIREDQVRQEDLQEGDLFFLQSFYESGDVKLASRLLRFEGDRFLVTTARIPRAALPGTPRIGDHFAVRAGVFQPKDVDPQTMWFYKLSRRMKKAFAGRPTPSTPLEIEADLQARLDWMKQRVPKKLPLGGDDAER